MANLLAIHSIGESLVSYFTTAYRAYQALPPDQRVDLDLSANPQFALVSSKELGGGSESVDPVQSRPALTLYLYRVTMNEHLRNQHYTGLASDAPPPLSLDLHYLLTVWADNAKDEHRLFTWAMHVLHNHQTLSASDLNDDGGWQPEELIQLIPAELSNEDLMRIWDTFQRPYALSASYIARVVQIEPELGQTGKPVVARRISLTNKGSGA
ncbi:DUF4255 domain-containing protein [Archangium violaceum]|uniref:DUF4255 domain-containing protein n=1 Tax=Archangium violaceum TaxID=83451 RepID=UPI00194EC346|nr:DUF4255 domain-containing protein [Archangium violaceum]QRN93093.1 DUF4255 domain-containing protein [Archangium violaceum]